MKNILILFGVLVIGGAARAQHVSVGVRTGTSYWMTRPDHHNLHFKAAPGQQYTWDQELFARYERKKRWAFELGLIHDNQSSSWNSQIFDSPYGNNIHTEYYYNYYSAPVSLQYDITCPYFKKCPVLKHLKSYIGICLIPTLQYNRTIETYESGIRFEYNYDPYFHVWTGLSQTMLYSIGQHWQISSVVSFRIKTNDIDFSEYAFGKSEVVANLGLRLGAAYRLY